MQMNTYQNLSIMDILEYVYVFPNIRKNARGQVRRFDVLVLNDTYEIPRNMMIFIRYLVNLFDLIYVDPNLPKIPYMEQDPMKLNQKLHDQIIGEYLMAPYQAFQKKMLHNYEEKGKFYDDLTHQFTCKMGPSIYLEHSKLLEKINTLENQYHI